MSRQLRPQLFLQNMLQSKFRNSHRVMRGNGIAVLEISAVFVIAGPLGPQHT